jgi:hypothetical protein
MNDDAASEHTLVHVRNALATDGRVGELGLDVRLQHGAVVVRGAVSTETRRQGVVELVTEVLRAHGIDLGVVNETSVPASEEPHERPERL